MTDDAWRPGEQRHEAARRPEREDADLGRESGNRERRFGRNRHRSGARTYSTGRMESFSDGVFAFAITLLVLDIVVPASSHRGLLGDFLAQWPSFLAYVVSFATIGGVWLAHNNITDHLVKSDSVFMRLNLLVLLFVAFLPFPTRFLVQYMNSEDDERVAVIIYGLSLFLLAGVISLLWRYAVRARLVDFDPDDLETTINTQRFGPGILAYVVLIVLGFFAPTAAVFGYLIVAIFIIIPLRLRRRGRLLDEHHHEQGDAFDTDNASGKNAPETPPAGGD